MKTTVLAALALIAAHPLNNAPERSRWDDRAARVTITRDDWGIAHIKGPTDADAVFGMIYAQAEDDFNRIEVNYLNALGRLAEAEGEKALASDLRARLIIDTIAIKQQYAVAPAWLRTLMVAWADGLNFYLAKHPEVRPRVLKRFEPWMPLAFSEGSIGGDIERGVDLARLSAFYGLKGAALAGAPRGDAPPEEPTGSNGFAVGPLNTASHKAMMLINPHTSFFFRSELHVTSDEGLDVYGASTWGQFFVYQGFNSRAGWMHTSSGADVLDEYLEMVTKRGANFTYRHGGTDRPVAAQRVGLRYKTAAGMATRTVTIYRTHHGPVIRAQDGKWVTLRLMQEPLKALTQSFTRTKSRTLAEFRQSMELHTNSSNNTIYADAQGNIAYFHANYVAKRDPRFNWRLPVDGSDPATEYQGVHTLDESPNAINPATGFIQNTNNWPFSVAGTASPKRDEFPRYMEMGEENPRGVHALRVLQARHDFTLQRLIDAAYDSELPAFESILPALFASYEQLAQSSPLKARLAEPIVVLKQWDRRWSATSIATSVAVFWGDELWRRSRQDAESEELSVYDYMATKAPPAMRLEALAKAIEQLTADFGSWKTPWGDINRFQRLTDDIVHPFSDAAPSIPVAFTSSRWGSLASFGARAYPGTKKWYGSNGNSFVAVVEFGDSVSARAVTAGGESGNTKSPHFNDQAQRYSRGELREVYFYPAQLARHTERSYHPGQ